MISSVEEKGRWKMSIKLIFHKSFYCCCFFMFAVFSFEFFFCLIFKENLMKIVEFSHHEEKSIKFKVELFAEGRFPNFQHLNPLSSSPPFASNLPFLFHTLVSSLQVQIVSMLLSAQMQRA